MGLVSNRRLVYIMYVNICTLVPIRVVTCSQFLRSAMLLFLAAQTTGLSCDLIVCLNDSYIALIVEI